MTDRLTGIIAALPQEIATLTRLKPAQGDCVEHHDNQLLAWSGAGPVNAERMARRLIDKGARRLISWGCAAALSPALKPGDLVVADRIRSDQGDFDTDTAWSTAVRTRLNDELSVYPGLIACSDRIIRDATEKKVIFEQNGAIALDMESSAIAAVARELQLPCLVIRAIADPADMNLPAAVADALKDDGTVDMAKLLWQIALHPGEIPGLIRLGMHFAAATKTLKHTADRLEQIIHL